MEMVMTMKLEKHILSAIDSYDRSNKEDALMHAVIVLDGTAKKLFLGKGR